jgi:hypothetical protein
MGVAIGARLPAQGCNEQKINITWRFFLASARNKLNTHFIGAFLPIFAIQDYLT